MCMYDSLITRKETNSYLNKKLNKEETTRRFKQSTQLFVFMKKEKNKISMHKHVCM